MSQKDGYTDAGKPTTSHQDKRKQLKQADLLDTTLGEVENLRETGHDVPGGFLKRNNFGDRF